MRFSSLMLLTSLLWTYIGCTDVDDDDATDDDATADDDDNAVINCEDAVPCEGDYVIGTTEDLDAIVQCETIAGDLQIESQEITNLELPCLTTVGGMLDISDNHSLATFELATLTAVGNTMTIARNGFLTHFDLPGLASVDQSVIIQENATLAGFDLSSLTTVSGDLDINYNDCLNQDDAQAFAAAISVDGTVNVGNNGGNYPCY